MAKKEQEHKVDVGEVYSKSEAFIETNKRPITIAVLAVVVIFGAFIGYKKLYVQPHQAEAQELIWKAEYFLEIDSLDKAIVGDGGNFGFEYIADEYSGTESGNLANYYLGTIYMKKQDYVLAIEYFKKSSAGGVVPTAQSLGNIGDAYVELDDIDQAISYFEKAANASSDDYTTPMYLIKAGIAYEALGNYSKAASAYRRVTEDHPNCDQIIDAKKYLGRAENMPS